jgi:hypothetical protein
VKKLVNIWEIEATIEGILRLLILFKIVKIKTNYLISSGQVRALADICLTKRNKENEDLF